MFELGFIGCGHMGGALAAAAAKAVCPEKIALYDVNAEAAASLALATGASALPLEQVAGQSRFVVLGVKPQVLPTVAKELSPLLAPEAVVVSMAAGIPLERLGALFAHHPLIRIMPNLPASLGEGILLYATCGVSAEQKEAFASHFAPCGLLDRLEEEKMDAAGALTGCGPAFAYIFAEALADGAVECGLPRDKAAAYAAQMLAGAGRMLSVHGSPAALKDAVCSAGGTTIAGVHALEVGGLRAAAMEAVCAAYRRSIELSKK